MIRETNMQMMINANYIMAGANMNAFMLSGVLLFIVR